MRNLNNLTLHFLQSHLIQPRPVLSRKIDAAILRIECYSVENVRLDCAQTSWQQPCTVNDSLDLAVPWVDDNDLVGGIDIGPYPAVNPFQFIEISDRTTVLGDI